uniref:Uncharacterized protein n=1 Tax=Anguilla anguilla TaxID=7936 RepID=A0A0E9VLY3_ANGAN
MVLLVDPVSTYVLLPVILCCFVQTCLVAMFCYL